MTSNANRPYTTLFWPKYWASSPPPPGDLAPRRVTPQPLELVERAQRGVKHVNDEIDVVEQHPAALRQPFHMMGPGPLGREGLHHVLGNRPDVRVRRPRYHDEEVGRVG